MNLFRCESLQLDSSRFLDFALEAGEIVGFTGDSGAGKTRLLRMLADLDPYFGFLFLKDQDCSSIPAPQWRRQVLYFPTESQWWYPMVGDHFSVVDTGDFAALGFDVDVQRWSVDRLSSGEKQRLALLRGLALHPTLLLLDEPTANLDQQNRLKVEALLRSKVAQATMAAVLVSHDDQQRRRICTRQYFLDAQGLRPISPEPAEA